MDPLFSSSLFRAGRHHLRQTRTMSNELLEKLNRRHENYETFLCKFVVTSCTSNPSVPPFPSFVHYFILFPSFFFFFFSCFSSYSCFLLFLLNSFSFTQLDFPLITATYFYTSPSPYPCSSIFLIFFHSLVSLLRLVPPIQPVVQALFLKLLRTTRRPAHSYRKD